MRYTQEGIIKNSAPFGKIFVAGAAAVTLAASMFASVFAAPSTVYVTPTDLKGWAPSDVRTGGTVEISNEMTDKTGGDASLKLALADTTAKAG